MPNCSILGCGLRMSKLNPTISLHRLPKNNVKRKKWLDSIGLENFKTWTKHIFICSNHFRETCFNRTLDKLILRDDAVPSLNSIPSSPPRTLKDIDQIQTPITAKHVESDEDTFICQDPIPSTSNETTINLPDQDRTIKMLQKKCRKYRVKIKRLHEKLRRQKKKIANLSNTIVIITK